MKTSTTRATSAFATATVGLLIAVTAVGGQTRVTAPENKYSPEEDVQLGREAAEEVEEQLPILRDETVTSAMNAIGERLVAEIPEEFDHPEFDYSFKVVNVSDINAFALPGGPMYLNRGMIEAARTEGEVASVIAHEMSHVALRHGTAQATKATPYQIGSVLGAILGSVIGGNVGSVVSAGTQFGLGAAFLRYGREYERQADILGSQIMAAAGYDPIEMANMIRTIEREQGSGGPEWLSSHPNPGNRTEYISREAEMLDVRNPVRDTARFERVQERLDRLEDAPTTEEAANGSRRSSSSNDRLDPEAVDRPSSRLAVYSDNDYFRVSVPSNWREVSSDGTSVIFAPDGAFGNWEGRGVFTHGVEVGIARTNAFDLREATEDFLDGLSRANPDLSNPSGYDRVNVDGRQGLHTQLSNRSDATGEQERIALYTALTDNDELFYVLGVSPRTEFGEYDDVFARVVESTQIR
ncbi:MAG: M48 family metalloprotease [Vicinamibacterales bacterium]